MKKRYMTMFGGRIVDLDLMSRLLLVVLFSVCTSHSSPAYVTVSTEKTPSVLHADSASTISPAFFPYLLSSEEPKCAPEEFRCNNSRCIRKTFVCDGEKDCEDNSDEDAISCASRQCEPGKVSCGKPMGYCIPDSWRCDGHYDCEDGSDELASNCSFKCQEPNFDCAVDKRCLPRFWVCDGMSDCSDHSDEANCTNVKCDPETQFTCKNSQCVWKSMKCDGDRDCIDGSDESANECIDFHSVDSICLPSQTPCADQVNCVLKLWVCDGDIDCPDGSDENRERCERQTCPNYGDFQCGGVGECVSPTAVCNGVEDCRDGSDEKHNCPGGNTTHPAAVTNCDQSKYFQCGGSEADRCIHLSKVCDGQSDCADHSDEGVGCGWCKVNNGNCSDLCVPLLGGRQCRCSPGYQLDDDKRTCIDVDECLQWGKCSHKCINTEGSFKCECLPGYTVEPSDTSLCKADDNSASLLLSHRSDLRQLMLHQNRFVSLIDGMNMGMYLDYDYKASTVYWVDIIDRSVYRTSISSASSEWTPIFTRSSCTGLAVDWVYGHLYMTNSEEVGGSIRVSNMDGAMVSKIILDKDHKLYAINLDPINGWMYWSSLGADPRIERAGMDGSNRHAIVTTRLENPRGLTIDLVQDRLYWTDAKLAFIETARTDGSDRRILISSRHLLDEPFSITTFEDFIYWTDWERNVVFKANKFTGSDAISVAPQSELRFPAEVRIYHPYRQPPAKNHCSSYNGGCSHLCLRTPLIPTSEKAGVLSDPDRHAVCACPDGLVLSRDERTCKLEGANDTVHKPPGHFVKVVSDKVKSGTVVGIVFGSLIAAIVVTSVALLIFRYLDRGYGRFRFSSPVYQKTTISAFKFSRDSAPFSSPANEELTCTQPMIHQQKLNLQC